MARLSSFSFPSPSDFRDRTYATQRELRRRIGRQLVEVLNAALEGLHAVDSHDFSGPPMVEMDGDLPIIPQPAPGLQSVISSGLTGSAKDRKHWDTMAVSLTRSPVVLEVAAGRFWDKASGLRVQLTTCPLASFAGSELCVPLYQFHSMFKDPDQSKRVHEAWDGLGRWPVPEGAGYRVIWPAEYIDELARKSKKATAVMKGATLDFPLADNGDVTVDLDAVKRFVEAAYEWVRVFREWPAERYDPRSVQAPAAGASAGVVEPSTEAGELANLLRTFKPQVILTGPPGTGKTRLARHAALVLRGRDNVDPDDAAAVASALKEEESNGYYGLVVFHPSFDYDSFIGGLSVKSQGSNVVYEPQDGIFVTMCERACKQRDQAFVLIIDELNRGNLPRLMGELLYALEYRNSGATLSYRTGDSARQLVVPENLFVIGTMNTADRSVDSLDVAIRRRFAFWPMEALPDRVEEHWGDVDPSRAAGITALMKSINEQLGNVDEARGLAIGHSYFLQKDYPTFQLAWKHQIRPLIEEYERLLGCTLRDVPGDELDGVKAPGVAER